MLKTTRLTPGEARVTFGATSASVPSQGGGRALEPRVPGRTRLEEEQTVASAPHRTAIPKASQLLLRGRRGLPFLLPHSALCRTPPAPPAPRVTPWGRRPRGFSGPAPCAGWPGRVPSPRPGASGARTLESGVCAGPPASPAAVAGGTPVLPARCAAPASPPPASARSGRQNSRRQPGRSPIARRSRLLHLLFPPLAQPRRAQGRTCPGARGRCIPRLHPPIVPRAPTVLHPSIHPSTD